MDEHIKKIEDRYLELYSEGYRPPVILEKLTEEFGMSYHVLYKRLDVKDLKKRAERVKP